MFRRIVSFLLLPGLVLGCVPNVERNIVPLPRVVALSDSSAARRPSFAMPDSVWLLAHLRDGSVLVLRHWTVDEGARRLAGRGRRLDPGRALVAEGRLAIALDSVALYETNAPAESLHPAVRATAIIVGIAFAFVALAAIGLALCGKACYGSCPTFYVTDGRQPVIQAEGFSASVAPALEASDVDALYRARPTGRDVEVTMTNEALETHVVRHVRLLAARRPSHGRVFATTTGEYWQAREPESALRAIAAEGDCARALAALDGAERWSGADSTDLASRETIDLEFPATDGRLAVVVGARQTLLTTYLFYQALAAMGHHAGEWFAALERGNAVARARTGGLGRALGGIEVLVPTGHGDWEKAGELCETGPLASDVRAVPLPHRIDGPVRVRLRLTRGYWRLDWVALATLEARVAPLRLDPAEVRRGDQVDEDARAALTDSARVLTTLPGDRFALRYRLPEPAERYELFLESRGYYLEWMRDDWLAEENPALAARMMLSPEDALRDLAPAFKRAEPRLEAQFWGSRYARP